jgi:hypothetical protein
VRFFFLVRHLLVVIAVVGLPVSASAALPIDEAARSLPDQLDQFRASSPAQLPEAGLFEQRSPEDFGSTSYATRTYILTSGRLAQVNVSLVKTLGDSGAFALLSDQRAGADQIKQGVVGTASIVHPGGMLDPAWVAFFKGRDFVLLSTVHKAEATQDDLLTFARGLAGGLDASEDDIPVLIRHLPQWQTAQPWARYAVSSNSLKKNAASQAILNEVGFDGGTEAVVADYGSARLVIIEFTTPQLSIDNDRRIAAKIQELRNAGEPVPTAYRRVGNYSVFVFNAPDEKTATELIDQVKYEQVVQWLGENPYWFEKAQRMYALKTAGVLIAVLQSSGLSLLICLGIGGIFGFFLFRRRRTQQASAAYSDAGGMTRLNIDELTAEHRDQKLLASDKS